MEQNVTLKEATQKLVSMEEGLRKSFETISDEATAKKYEEFTKFRLAVSGVVVSWTRTDLMTWVEGEGSTEKVSPSLYAAVVAAYADTHKATQDDREFATGLLQTLELGLDTMRASYMAAMLFGGCDGEDE